MEKDITLLVLAAGMGSRFGGLKQMEPMGPNGEFIIDYSVFDAVRAGFTKVVFIIREEMEEEFKKTIGSRVEPHIKVEYAFQKNDNLPAGFDYPEDRKKPYGTGHAMMCAKDLIHENFAIISADDFYGYDAFKKAADFLKENDDYCVIGYRIGETLSDKGEVKRGICMEEDGYLTSVIESKAIKDGDKVLCTPLNGSEPFYVEEDHPVSMLMFGFPPTILDELEQRIIKFFEANKDNMDTCEYLFPDVLDQLIKEGIAKVRVIPTTSKWYGVTYKEDAPVVRESIKKLVKTKDNDNGDYPLHLWGE